jgi:GNAT superfamily N-acetyltransferase
MAELPTGYQLRAPTTSDVATIAAVVTAHDVADFGEPDFSEQDLLDDWQRPRFSLDTDAWVVSGPTGRTVAYAYVWESQPGQEFEADAFVLPEYAGRGLGGRLLQVIESRARAIAADRPMAVGVFASSANAEKRNLLIRRGYRYVRSVLRMKIDLARQPVEPDELSAAAAFGPLEPADVDRVREVWRRAFEDHGRFSPRRMDEWLDARFAHPAFDPSLCRIAEVEGEVVGAVIVFDVGPTGYTSSVAVRPESRGSGIGPALLRAAFGALRDRGQMRVVVSLDAEVESSLQALYEAAGMRVHERHDLYELALGTP